MRSAVWYLGTLAGAFAGGIASLLITLIFFLLVGETMFYFLSLGVNALFAALGAVWTGNALATDGSRGYLLWIVIVSEVTAISLATLNLAFVDMASESVISQVTLGQRMAASTAVVALVSSIAAWSMRHSDIDVANGVARDTRVTAIVCAFAAIIVVGAILLDSLLSPVPY